MKTCWFCDSEILPGEADTSVLGCTEIHRDCLLRSIIGSVGHQRRLCSCYGGTGNGDPEGVSKRECSRLAREEFEKNRINILPPETKAFNE